MRGSRKISLRQQKQKNIEFQRTLEERNKFSAAPTYDRWRTNCCMQRCPSMRASMYAVTSVSCGMPLVQSQRCLIYFLLFIFLPHFCIICLCASSQPPAKFVVVTSCPATGLEFSVVLCRNVLCCPGLSEPALAFYGHIKSLDLIIRFKDVNFFITALEKRRNTSGMHSFWCGVILSRNIPIFL